MKQLWHDLLFMHWPVNAAVLRRLVPAALPLDTFDGKAWIGVVPFRMSGIRLRGLPPVPGLSAFPELNVRTYVTMNGKPGVFFFSLDATNPVAVYVARHWFHLPYYFAHMSLEEEKDLLRYRSVRRSASAPPELLAAYHPRGGAQEAVAGTLDYWLTERYCLYTSSPDGKIFRAEILHSPWPLQPAEVTLERNTMTSHLGLVLPATAPLVHFSRYQEVLIWPPERVQ